MRDTLPAPRLEPRPPEAIAAAVRHALGASQARGDALAEGLLAVFDRYAEALAQALNAAPQQRLDAFVDLLAPTRHAARPATTTLRFAPVARRGAAAATTPTCLPAGTQVAGPAPAGASEPVVFETVAPLELCEATLARAVAIDAAAGRWACADALAAPAGLAAAGPWDDAQPWPAELHVPLPVEALPPAPFTLTLRIEVDERVAPPPGTLVAWRLHGAGDGPPLQPLADGTAGLTRSGDVVFAGLAPWPASTLAGHSAAWLGCRLVGAAGQLPPIRTLAFLLAHDAPAQPVAAALCGGVALDTSREFFPLGERPRFGDVFLVQADAFARPGAQVRLAVTLLNPSDAGTQPPVPRVGTAHAPRLCWDLHTARGWIPLDPRADGTASLTRSGTLEFTTPDDAAPASIGGRPGGWLRARLAGGDYAVPNDAPAPAAVKWPDLPCPPVIATASVAATLRSPARPITQAVLDAGLGRELLWAPWATAALAPDAREAPALCLGLRPAAPGALAGRRLHLVLQFADVPGAAVDDAAARDALPPLRCALRGADGWQALPIERLPAQDAGVEAIVLALPSVLPAWCATTLDADLLWLRLDWAGARPPLKRVSLNAVPAVQQRTVLDEVLGSGLGVASQQVALAHAPVIGEPVLEVREPGPLDATERQALLRAQGPEAVRPIPAQGRLPAQAWVRWTRVDDFAASTPQSRHYVLDAQDGRIVFGDGRHGRIAPVGANNLVMRRYRSGGGAAGNLPAGSVKQLRTTLPYVEAVSNPEPACGGQDVEDAASARAGAAAWLRHRDRAVGADDFVALARRAAPEVAEAYCMPERDLAADPAGGHAAPGCVSVIVLPRAAGTDVGVPQVPGELLRRVHAFLRERCASDLRLCVVPPAWLPVDVELELHVAPGQADGLARDCAQRIARFLHPLHGGADGTGWPFGRLPRSSDVIAALRPGLQDAGAAEIRLIRLRPLEPLPGLRRSGHFILRAGTATVRIVR
jgi:hypothetical protein